MTVRAIVKEDSTYLRGAVAPGPDADRFRKRYEASYEGPLFLDEKAYAAEDPYVRDMYLSDHRRVSKRFPEGWHVFELLNVPGARYKLMDWFVDVFDADVDWPDYQWGLQNLRARRDRQRAWTASSHERPIGPTPSTRRYPRNVLHAYTILECEAGTAWPEIRKAYKLRSLEHHPDRGGSEERMKRINRAMEILRGYLAPEGSVVR